MDETFRTLVLVQRVLTIVCLAVVTFNLSDEKTVADYANALSEYREIDPAINFIESKLNDEYINYFYKTGIVDVLKEKLGGFERKALSFSFDFNNLPNSIYNFPSTDELALGEIRSYFSRVPKFVTIRVPKKDEILEALDNMKEDYPWIGASIDADGIDNIEFNVSLEKPDFMKESNLSAYQLNSVMQIQWALKNIGSLAPKIELGLTLSSGGQSLGSYQLLTSTNTNTAAISFADVWVYLSEKGVFFDAGENLIILPKLRLLWREVDELVGDEIAATLEREAYIEKNTHPQRELELLGLKLTNSFSYIVFPVSLVAILIYMRSHMLHAQRMVVTHGTGVVGEYPWIGLYSDKPSRAVFFTMILVIPAGSTLFAVYISEIEYVFKHILASIFIVVIIIIALSILRISRWFHEQIELMSATH